MIGRSIFHVIIIFVVLFIVILISAGFYFYKLAISRSKKSLLKDNPDLISGNTDNPWASEREWLDSQECKKIIMYSSNGLTLCAHYLAAAFPTSVTAILIHGYTGKGKDMSAIAKYYHEIHGFNVLMPDCRGHGESEGDYIGFGWHDRLDILRWIDYIINYTSKSIRKNKSTDKNAVKAGDTVYGDAIYQDVAYRDTVYGDDAHRDAVYGNAIQGDAVHRNTVHKKNTLKGDIIYKEKTIHKPESEAKIILHGVSMGGATVLMTSGEKLPPNVKLIISDCAYTSVRDILSYQLKRMFKLPKFPFIQITSLICKLKAGYFFGEASALSQVQKARVPILFIHGSEDKFVPTEMVYKLHKAAKSEKQLFIVDKASHGNAFWTDIDGYTKQIEGLIKKYVL
ncbi:MAG: alpha/beta hydrolase [Clostridiaceae bacterium]|nr:alpha/beta hydrolase [Clostridiaceae bacterium]